MVGSCQLSVVEKKWRRKGGGETPGRVQQFTKETPQGPVVQKEDPTVGSGGIVSCHYCGGVGGGRGGGGGGGETPGMGHQGRPWPWHGAQKAW